MADSVKKQIAQLLLERFPDYDPVVALAEIAQDKETPLDLRVRCHESVAKYVHPQLRAVDVRSTRDPEEVEGLDIEVIGKDGETVVRH